ncbi:MAG: 50S ribosomal protein L1 [Nitrospirales bacterium]|nr:50S ribosomal protein L1 [Nitrospirales bacterium]
MGKNLRAASAKVEVGGYSLQQAGELIKDVAFAKFDETVELAIRLGIDPRRADQMVRGTTVLPHGSGKTVRILVFAKGEKEREAREAGADYVGADELMEKIKEGWLDFDQAISTPDLMASVGKLGKVLGPRGLMPNPKTGTVTFEVAKAIQEIRRGRVEYKVDKAGIVHVPVAKASFSASQISENAQAVFSSIMKAKPSSSKGRYLKNATLSCTQGPGIPLDSLTIARHFD